MPLGVSRILLALNIGNTNLTGAVWDSEHLLTQFRLHTDLDRTADEYGALIGTVLDQNGVTSSDVRSVAICSVVPVLTSVIAASSARYSTGQPLIVGPGLSTQISIGYEDPGQLGADRIANAEAAYLRYGGPVVVADLGTATTVDAVTSDGVFAGGAIAPGIGISVEALLQRTARLGRVELTAPETAIGRSTSAGLRSGVIFGFAGQVDALVDRISKELGGAARIVATGGLAHLIAPVSRTIEEVVPLLTLDGIRLIHDRNRPAAAR
jgi:type III pantothenate kinase